MPKLYVLVGIPCSGKSTWVSSQLWAKDCVVVSTDNHVEDYAKHVGKTYSEVFDEYMPTAVNLMTEDVIAAREAGKDIIWDQTSVSRKPRARKLRMLPDYYKVAVVFPTPDKDELKKRLESRPGKVIPPHVIESMINSFVMPSKEEGFDEIWMT